MALLLGWSTGLLLLICTVLNSKAITVGIHNDDSKNTFIPSQEISAVNTQERNSTEYKDANESEPQAESRSFTLPSFLRGGDTNEEQDPSSIPSSELQAEARIFPSLLAGATSLLGGASSGGGTNEEEKKEEVKPIVVSDVVPLDKHPLWSVHKYQGIAIRPVPLPSGYNPPQPTFDTSVGPYPPAIQEYGPPQEIQEPKFPEELPPHLPAQTYGPPELSENSQGDALAALDNLSGLASLLPDEASTGTSETGPSSGLTLEDLLALAELLSALRNEVHTPASTYGPPASELTGVDISTLASLLNSQTTPSTGIDISELASLLSTPTATTSGGDVSALASLLNTLPTEPKEQETLLTRLRNFFSRRPAFLNSIFNLLNIFRSTSPESTPTAQGALTRSSKSVNNHLDRKVTSPKRNNKDSYTMFLTEEMAEAKEIKGVGKMINVIKLILHKDDKFVLFMVPEILKEEGIDRISKFSIFGKAPSKLFLKLKKLKAVKVKVILAPVKLKGTLASKLFQLAKLKHKIISIPGQFAAVAKVIGYKAEVLAKFLKLAKIAIGVKGKLIHGLKIKKAIITAPFKLKKAIITAPFKLKKALITAPFKLKKALIKAHFKLKKAILTAPFKLKKAIITAPFKLKKALIKKAIKGKLKLKKKIIINLIKKLQKDGIKLPKSVKKIKDAIEFKGQLLGLIGLIKDLYDFEVGKYKFKADLIMKLLGKGKDKEKDVPSLDVDLPNILTESGGINLPNVQAGSGGISLSDLLGGSGGIGLLNLLGGSGGTGLPNLLGGSGGIGLPNLRPGSGGIGLPNLRPGSGGIGLPNLTPGSGNVNLPGTQGASGGSGIFNTLSNFFLGTTPATPAAETPNVVKFPELPPIQLPPNFKLQDTQGGSPYVVHYRPSNTLASSGPTYPYPPAPPLEEEENPFPYPPSSDFIPSEESPYPPALPPQDFPYPPPSDFIPSEEAPYPPAQPTQDIVSQVRFPDSDTSNFATPQEPPIIPPSSFIPQSPPTVGAQIPSPVFRANEQSFNPNSAEQFRSYSQSDVQDVSYQPAQYPASTSTSFSQNQFNTPFGATGVSQDESNFYPSPEVSQSSSSSFQQQPNAPVNSYGEPTFSYAGDTEGFTTLSPGEYLFPPRIQNKISENFLVDESKRRNSGNNDVNEPVDNGSYEQTSRSDSNTAPDVHPPNPDEDFQPSSLAAATGAGYSRVVYQRSNEESPSSNNDVTKEHTQEQHKYQESSTSQGNFTRSADEMKNVEIESSELHDGSDFEASRDE